MELFKLLGTIAIDGSGANSAIDETTAKAEKSESKISNAFEKIGSAAVKVGQVVATGLTVASAAITALTKTAFDGYADYEQLVGGVETLFKDSSDAVLEYANNAYKSAGLSANAYMETVTSFSASLLQSLGSDTQAAADKANMAIIDMADNANKMGSDLTMIQNAYSGFARNNFTMLDNLKLGYAGSQQEMYRLMQDAAKLDKTFAENAVFSLDSKGHLEAKFSDIVDAIHIIQTEMGITGTTAKEASTTIQGSVASMKSAWSNLLTSMGDENANLSQKIDEFIESTLVAVDNVIPRIGMILSGMSEVIAKIMPIIAAELPALIESLLPSLITGAVALFNGLVAALPVILQILIEQMPFIITEVGKGLMNAFPILLGVVKDLFGQMFDYISLKLSGTGASFEDALTKISGFFSKAWSAMQKIWNDIGLPIWNAIIQTVQNLDTIFGKVFTSAKGTFSDTLATIKEVFSKTLSVMKKVCEDVWSATQDTFSKALTFMQNAFENAWSAMQRIWSDIGQPIWDMIEDAFQRAWFLLQSVWTDVGKPIFDKITEAMSGFSGVSTDVFGKFSEIIKLLVENYLSNLMWKFETAVELFKTAVVPAVEIVIGTVVNLAKSIIENVAPAVMNIMGRFSELATLVKKAISEYIVPYVSAFINMIKELYEENKDKLSLIGELFGAVADWFSQKIDKIVEGFKKYLMPVIEWVVESVKKNMDKIKAVFQAVIDIVAGIIRAFIALFKGDWEGLWQAIKDILKAGWDFIVARFEMIKAFFGDIWAVIREACVGAWDKIVGGIKDKINEAKDEVFSVFNSIKSKIDEIMGNIKGIVEKAIEKVKGFFGFEISLPDIKLPHFSIQPDGWKIGDLLKGDIPSLGIDWYAEGGIMTRPTVFGMNGNNAMVGGEAGAEAIAPIDILQRYVSEAVASQNAALIAVLYKILDAIIALDENMGGNLREALEGTSLDINRREFARLVKAVN